MVRNIAALRRILPEEDCDRLFAEPRWQKETPYHEDLLAGVTPLHNPADLPLLLDSLEQGVAAAAKAAGADLPPVLQRPPAAADLAEWDGVLAEAMDHLLRLDALARQKGTAAPEKSLWRRVRAALP